jgi:hypothetical protein
MTAERGAVADTAEAAAIVKAVVVVADAAATAAAGVEIVAEAEAGDAGRDKSGSDLAAEKHSTTPWPRLRGLFIAPSSDAVREIWI